MHVPADCSVGGTVRNILMREGMNRALRYWVLSHVLGPITDTAVLKSTAAGETRDDEEVSSLRSHSY